MKNILFDLDGTLTNPQEGILNCIRYALDKLDVKHPQEKQLISYIGPPLWESFQEMLGTDSYEEADNAVQLYRERFSDVGKFENTPYAGVHTMLDKLAKGGYTMYICTSKPAVFAEDIARHFEFYKYFRKIYGSRLDGSLVEKDQLIAHLLTEEKIHPSDAVMIGDRKYDILGAKSNGVTAFGVSYGFGSPEELADSAGIFASPTEIAEHFCSLQN